METTRIITLAEVSSPQRTNNVFSLACGSYISYSHIKSSMYMLKERRQLKGTNLGMRKERIVASGMGHIFNTQYAENIHV